jgi:predicted transcriptional regulator
LFQQSKKRETINKRLSETQFWKCYFYFIYLIRNEKEIHLLDEKFEKMIKDINKQQEEEMTEILNNSEDLEKRMKEMKFLLNDVIVNSIKEGKNPYSKEIEEKIEIIFEEKKKISFLIGLDDITDNDEFMKKIISLDQHFTNVILV